MKPLKNSSLIICGIVRNAEKGLRTNIPIINALCKHCKDYRIVIYENDSTDNTKRILQDWAETNPERVHVLLNNTDKSLTIPSSHEVQGNPFYSHKRIEKMAALRNKYLEYIAQQGWTSDFLIVVDMDVAQLSLDGILSSFNSDVDWDAVAAFGYSTSPKLRRRYHDTYALCEFGKENIPQTEKMISYNADKYARLCRKEELIRVYSAFGGLTIYKFEAIRGLRYELIDNDDTRVMVRCEHYSICKQMANNGFNKVYINPKMKLKYQNLTLDIAIKSLQRHLLTTFNMGGGKTK